MFFIDRFTGFLLPFHVKDFGSFLSIVIPIAISTYTLIRAYVLEGRQF